MSAHEQTSQVWGWAGQYMKNAPAWPPTVTEQDTVLQVFTDMLKAVTADGGRKRQAGFKVPWWRDAGHEAAIFSHLKAWKQGIVRDRDSGAHPLVHLAWRALAIAYQETRGRTDPASTAGDVGP